MGKATGSGKGDKQLRSIQKLKLKFQDPDVGSAMPSGSRTDRRLRGKPRLATSPLHLVSSHVGEENLRVGSETIFRPSLNPPGNQSPWGTGMLPFPTRSSLLGAQVREGGGRGLCQLTTPPCKCQGRPGETLGSAQDVMPASTACGHHQGSDQKRSQLQLSQHLTAPLSQTGN